MPWFKLWTTEWLGMTAGLSSDSIALLVQVLVQSWNVGRDGVMEARVDQLARLTGLDSTRTRQALDELSTRDHVFVNGAKSESRPLTIRVPYLEREAARREQQAKSWSRRQFDKNSTPQAQRLRSSEAQTTKERETPKEAASDDDDPNEDPEVSLSSDDVVAAETLSDSAILEVFAHYRTLHPDAFRNPQRNSKEWGLIEARLRDGRTVDELKLAIDGCHADPWHRGVNSWGTPHLELSLIFRDASKTNGYIAMARTPPMEAPTTRDSDRRVAALCRDAGWPKWERACKEKGIPTEAALAEWQDLRQRLCTKPGASVGPEHLEDFARRYVANLKPPEKTDRAAFAS